MMLIGSSIYVAPVTQWDDQVIGDGKPGPVTKAMRELLEEDMRSGEGMLIDVPYSLGRGKTAMAVSTDPFAGLLE